MSTAELLGYTLAALLLTVTPGLDTMLVLRSVIVGGNRTGLATGVGITLGCVVWGAASIGGLTALLATSHLAYDIVRFAGAGYLLWLGGSALWRSLRRVPQPVGEEPVERPPGMAAAFRTGLLTNLLNPKVGAFYLSLLPQFVPIGAGSSGWAALLVAIHIGLGLLWQASLIWLGSRARHTLARPSVRRWTERLAATALIGFGLKVALDGS